MTPLQENITKALHDMNFANASLTDAYSGCEDKCAEIILYELMEESAKLAQKVKRLHSALCDK